jgi:hypothetical protein
MKKCPYCLKEIQNEALKCAHCGKLLNSPTGLREIWNRYWGYIISVPVVIICVAFIILSIADLSKENSGQPAETKKPTLTQQTKPSANASRPVSWQKGITPEALQGLTDEQFKRIVDRNPELSRAGVRYDIHNGKMMRYIPSAEKLASIGAQQQTVNDEVYHNPKAAADAENVKHREELHRKQIQQLKELYR